MELENVEVKLRLSTLTPLQEGWIIDFFDERRSCKGAKIIKSGWFASEIKDAADLALEKLSSIDPFKELDPMIADSEDVVILFYWSQRAFVRLKISWRCCDWEVVPIVILMMTMNVNGQLKKIKVLSRFLKTDLYR